VSDVSAVERDVTQQEVSLAVSDSQNVGAKTVIDDEVNQTAGNTEKESVMMKDTKDKEMEEVAAANDAEESSQMSEAAEAKDDGNKQPEL